MQGTRAQNVGLVVASASRRLVLHGGPHAVLGNCVVGGHGASAARMFASGGHVVVVVGLPTLIIDYSRLDVPNKRRLASELRRHVTDELAEVRSA